MAAVRDEEYGPARKKVAHVHIKLGEGRDELGVGRREERGPLADGWESMFRQLVRRDAVRGIAAQGRQHKNWLVGEGK